MNREPAILEGLRFLGTFLKAPTTIGAVAPSSAALAREMLRPLDFNGVRAIVEYGPGTGSFSRHILERLKPGTEYFCLEADPRMVEYLARTMPDLRVLPDSAARVLDHLERGPHREVDAIVSGLPFAAFKPSTQSEILDATVQALTPGGVFTTFAYQHALALPTARRFARELHGRFATVARSRIVWRNIPPAFVYICTR